MSRYRDDSTSQDLATDDDLSCDEREYTLTSNDAALTSAAARDENQNVNKGTLSSTDTGSLVIVNGHAKGATAVDQSAPLLQEQHNTTPDDNRVKQVLNTVFHSSPDSAPGNGGTAHAPSTLHVPTHVVLDEDMETVLETKQLRPSHDDVMESSTPETVDGTGPSRGSYSVQNSATETSGEAQQQFIKLDDDKKTLDVTSASTSSSKPAVTPTTPKTPPGIPEELKKVERDAAMNHTVKSNPYQKTCAVLLVNEHVQELLYILLSKSMTF